jgi:hypothetical protein
LLRAYPNGTFVRITTNNNNFNNDIVSIIGIGAPGRNTIEVAPIDRKISDRKITRFSLSQIVEMDLVEMNILGTKKYYKKII